MGTQATQVTHGIKISVETKFQSEHSVAEHRHFLFSYRITIENKSEYTVQLISRHWDIYDSSSEHSEVDGEGVEPFGLPHQSDSSGRAYGKHRATNTAS